jgi:HlyD family secretion protein
MEAENTLDANKINPENLVEFTGGKTELPPINGFESDFSPRRPAPEVNLVSEAVNEVLSSPPSWIIHWGNTIFFSLFLVLGIISWIVKYPDLLKANLKILATNLPKSVNTRVDGKLIKLFVKDGQQLQKNEIIAFLESTANHTDVLDLEKKINTILSADNLSAVYSAEVPAYYQLGELQKSFQSFEEVRMRVKSFIGAGTYLQKKDIIQNDLSQLQALQIHQHNQLENVKNDLTLAEDEFDRQKALLNDHAISKNDYNMLISKVISKKQAFEQANSAIKNNIMQQNQKRQELLELDKLITEQKNIFVQTLHTLKSELEDWKRRYLVVAPTQGRAVFSASLQENQLLKSGQELMYILPDGEGFQGEMNIGQYNFGKVRIGQEVIIKLQSFPYQEYGTVSGKIENISEIPKDSVYWVRVSFPQGLKTSSNKMIPFRNGMSANAEIITSDKRLIERFFEEFLKVIK